MYYPKHRKNAKLNFKKKILNGMYSFCYTKTWTDLLQEREDVGFGDCVLTAHTEGGPGTLLRDQ